jgi:signal transduction histidine kinase
LSDRSDDKWHRVLVLAPVGRDSELIASVFRDSGLQPVECADGDALYRHIAEGVGAAIVAEEALSPELMLRLAVLLGQQPPWSDLPFLILTGQPRPEPQKPRSFAQLGRRVSLTLVDRPVRMKTLVMTVEALLRFRDRQYEIRDLMEKLEERIHERDRFLAILGHELRNPLAAIMLATQMTRVDDGCLEAEHVHRIEQQSRHLNRLVNDLLDLSRVTSGKIVLRPVTMNLAQSVEQCVNTMRSAARSQSVDLRLHVEGTPAFVNADPTRLDQIVSNVLTNAIKYTPEGGTVDVTVRTEGGNAAIVVRDDGVGIDSERIASIFELFAQAENAIGRAQGGMGIGLALVRNLVELHGGSVTATSDGVGKGSTFTVLLPLASASERANAPAQSVPPPEKPVDGDGKRRVVIVEDNPDLRELLRMKLRRLGHDVDAASDGHDGLAMLLEQKPDVAFVDIGLPGIDGYEIAQKVRESLGERVMLVALSGFGQPDDKRKALEAGFDQHLTKPAEIADIERVLESAPR